MADPVDPTLLPIPYSPPPLVFQQFVSQNGELLPSILTSPIEGIRGLFVLWGDIQDAFADIAYLLDSHGERVLFEVTRKDGNYER